LDVVVELDLDVDLCGGGVDDGDVCLYLFFEYVVVELGVDVG